MLLRKKFYAICNHYDYRTLLSVLDYMKSTGRMEELRNENSKITQLLNEIRSTFEYLSSFVNLRDAMRNSLQGWEQAMLSIDSSNIDILRLQVMLRDALLALYNYPKLLKEHCKSGSDSLANSDVVKRLNEFMCSISKKDKTNMDSNDVLETNEILEIVLELIDPDELLEIVYLIRNITCELPLILDDDILQPLIYDLNGLCKILLDIRQNIIGISIKEKEDLLQEKFNQLKKYQDVIHRLQLVCVANTILVFLKKLPSISPSDIGISRVMSTNNLFMLTKQLVILYSGNNQSISRMKCQLREEISQFVTEECMVSLEFLLRICVLIDKKNYSVTSNFNKIEFFSKVSEKISCRLEDQLSENNEFSQENKVYDAKCKVKKKLCELRCILIQYGFTVRVQLFTEELSELIKNLEVVLMRVENILNLSGYYDDLCTCTQKILYDQHNLSIAQFDLECITHGITDSHKRVTASLDKIISRIREMSQVNQLVQPQLLDIDAESTSKLPLIM